MSDLFALVDGGNDVTHELFHEAAGEFGALVDEAEFLVIFLREQLVDEELGVELAGETCEVVPL